MTRDQAARKLTGKRTTWFVAPVEGQKFETWAVEGNGHELLGYIATLGDDIWYWNHPAKTGEEWREL